VIKGDKVYYVGFGKRLRHAREAAGLTQTQLAEKLMPPTCHSCISGFESGKRRVAAHLAVQLATALNVPAQTLLAPGALS